MVLRLCALDNTLGKPGKRRCAVAYRRCASISGRGWRMYYVQRGAVLIVMLGGGRKATQATDIAKAVKRAVTLEE